MSPSRRLVKGAFAPGKIACILATVATLTSASVAAPRRSDISSLPTAEFGAPFETSGSVLAGSVLTVDPCGSESHALALGDVVAVSRARIAYAANFAVAARLRHHASDAGGNFYLTRQDDRPATASLNDDEARLRVVINARPHCVLIINHESTTKAGERLLLVPAEDKTTSDPTAVEVAQVLAKFLQAHGFGHFEVRPAHIPVAQRTGVCAVE
ncbi:MAG: hypothetical protein N2Z21_09560, partial [Candidatus Sumerlaeaceae bacterium]|nr:hypothetical protein [Candidatus Sumerlaeaceae bacterium]